MKKRGKKPEIDAGLDEEIDHYEPSDSDDGFEDEERHMLNNAVGRKQNFEEKEVLKIYSSSEDSDEEEEDNGGEGIGDQKGKTETEEQLYGGGVDSDEDSDIVDKPKDGLPDSKAWGSDKRQYYNTDYVDKDYLDFDDEDAAIAEEKEADVIQRRLLARLEGTDFSLGLLDEVEDKKKEAAQKKDEPDEFEEEEKVEADLSSFSQKECLKLLKRESPEMFPLLDHCKSKLSHLMNKILPILKMVDDGTLKKCMFTSLLEIANKLTLHYSMNVLFYLYSKENGESTNNHPVVKRLNAFKCLLAEVNTLMEQLNPQIEMILGSIELGEELVFKPESKPLLGNRKEKRKRKLELIKQIEEEKKIIKTKKRKLMKVQRKAHILNLERTVKEKEIKVQYEEEEEKEEPVSEKDAQMTAEGEKRSVTFNILKNKGLTPRRKKENRNPRVKNRNKYKKAIKRRRGQVREPKKELNRYGGEISGIKRNIAKSITIK